MLLTAIVIVLAVGLALCFVLVLGLAREVGRLQMRLGPIGARMMAGGPGIGDHAPRFDDVVDRTGQTVQVGGPTGRDSLLMFVSPGCPICRSLVPGLRALARAERGLDVVLVSDGEDTEHDDFLADAPVGSLAYVVSRPVGMAFQVGTTPYGVVLDGTGVVRAKGLVNHMQQVESLLHARDTGMASLQQLSARLASERAATGAANGHGHDHDHDHT